MYYGGLGRPYGRDFFRVRSKLLLCCSPFDCYYMILMSDRKEEVGLEVGVEDSKQFNNKGLVQSQASTVVEICL